MTPVVKRFLEYVKYDTKSCEESKTTPSSNSQLVFAKNLAAELKSVGMKDVSVDENGYVMASLPSNTDKKIPTIGFIAHMDTSPDMSGTNVNPKIVENYDGKDILLNKEKNILLSPKDFPELKNYIGKTLITTNGNTLLGADDKAGVAEIVTAMEHLIQHPEIKHGTIKVGFTPDEEIGCGADHFDVEKFNADFAYTMDGGQIGELEYENFNAASAKFIINGRNIHPGSAKNKMINSMSIAAELIESFPKNEVPECTDNYEGFYHLISIDGNVEKTIVQYIIRDFDKDNFKKRKSFTKETANKFKGIYGDETVELEIKDQYYNMKEKIIPVKHIVDIVIKAMELVDVTPLVQPIRGGTDGARLSFMNLPTPNIFTGGHNFHGKYEFIPTYAMDKAIKVILKVIELYTKADSNK